MRIVRTVITWAIVLAIAFVAYKYVFPLFKPVKAEMDVQTTEVTKGDLRITVPCDGTVVPRVLVEVKSKAAGVVLSLNVEPGDEVKAGQVICELDRQETQAQLKQAMASLTQAKAQLTLTARSLSPQQRASAESAVKSATISRDDAQAKYDRLKKLYDKGYATEEEMSNAKTALDQAEENLTAAQQQYTLDLKGAQPEEIDVAKAAIVKSQAAVDQLKDQLAYSTIRAPQSGTVLTRPVEVGTAVASGTSGFSGGTVVCTIGDLSTLYVKAYIDETDLGKVNVGAPCRIAFDAFQGWIWHGKVKKIYPQGEIATGGGATGSASFQIDIELSQNSAEQDGSAARAGGRGNGGGGRPGGAGRGAGGAASRGGGGGRSPGGPPGARGAAEGKPGAPGQAEGAAQTPKQPPKLRPQQSASVDIVLDDHPGVLMIPAQYIKYDKDKPYVYVLPDPKDQTKREKRELELGFTDGLRYEIKSGLKEGETVLLERPIKKETPRGG